LLVAVGFASAALLAKMVETGAAVLVANVSSELEDAVPKSLEDAVAEFIFNEVFIERVAFVRDPALARVPLAAAGMAGTVPLRAPLLPVAFDGSGLKVDDLVVGAFALDDGLPVTVTVDWIVTVEVTTAAQALPDCASCPPWFEPTAAAATELALG